MTIGAGPSLRPASGTNIALAGLPGQWQRQRHSVRAITVTVPLALTALPGSPWHRDRHGVTCVDRDTAKSLNPGIPYLSGLFTGIPYFPGLFMVPIFIHPPAHRNTIAIYSSVLSFFRPPAGRVPRAGSPVVWGREAGAA